MESIKELIRQHPSERVFRYPIYWTKRHLELLNCAFVVAYDKQTKPLGKEDARAAKQVRILVLWCGPSMNSAALAALFREGRISIAESEDTPQFCYASLRIDCCSCTYFHLRNAAYPPIAYVDIDKFPIIRDSSFSQPRLMPGKPDYKNTPVRNLRVKRIARVTPQDPVQDPYIISLIVAIAQTQLVQGTSPSVDIYTVRLLGTSKHDSDHIYLYTASVPLGFLGRFYHPNIAP
ncbi:hypothetical protein F4677DRAFT_463431 [Hypoxylon crocopeplum]|nr:hypothetical protein F4677DRAFT_463431 [Hypoxylon crocopeplum]